MGLKTKLVISALIIACGALLGTALAQANTIAQYDALVVDTLNQTEAALAQTDEAIALLEKCAASVAAISAAES